MTQQARMQGLHPAYFALVMATGVVSIILHSEGWPQTSNVLLGVGLAELAVLLAVAGWSLVRYRQQTCAPAVEPRRAFLFLTFAAAWNVLSTRLSMQGLSAVALAFLVVGGAAWVLLTYVIPLALIVRGEQQSARPGADGTWFMWVVGTQTVAVAATSLATPLAVRLAALAVICWSVGVVLYVIISTVVLTLLLRFRANPAELTPAYWIFMGGAAISVVAGLQILRLRSGTFVAASRPVVGGVSVMLWSFGTWLIPLLLVLGVWKHLVRRVRLSYEPALWGVVFVIGMYGLASHGLGGLLRLGWMAGLGVVFEWITVALWVVTFAAMLWSLSRAVRPAHR